MYFSVCLLEQIDDELFNPDYVEIDRILDFSRSTDDNGEVNRTSSVFVVIWMLCLECIYKFEYISSFEATILYFCNKCESIWKNTG